MSKVAVVLVNYHDYAKRFLAECRQSLLAQNYDQKMINYYVVDNDSSEDSFDYLKKNFPEAKILRRNDGNYSAANNFGFNEAIKDNCQYLITVNMDTVMDKNWLSELVKAIKTSPDIGIVQSKILLYSSLKEKRNIINTLGNKLNYLGFGFTGSYGKEDREDNEYRNIEGYASGCSFITTADIFKKIGAWNEEYYMYHDDVEFSLKIKLAGYRIILAPRSVVYHKYEFSRSIKMFYFMERNRYLTLFIFADKKYLGLIFLPLFLIEIGMLVKSFFDKTFKQRIKLYLYFLRPASWRNIREERKKIRAIKNKSFSSLSKDFSSSIEFAEISSPLFKYFVNPFLRFFWFIIKPLV